MRISGLLAGLCFILTACHPTYEDFYVCYDNGVPKPKVAFFPVQVDGPATDLSADLTAGIRTELMRAGHLYLFPADSTEKVLQQIGRLDWSNKEYPFVRYIHPAEYAVLLEVCEHQVVPFRPDLGLSFAPPARPCFGDDVLLMKVRVKVLDLRESPPRPLLQETYRGHYLLSSPLGSLLASDPLQSAYARLMADLAQHIEGYILESH